MRTPELLFLLLLASYAANAGDEGFALRHADEQAAWGKLAARFKDGPEITRKAGILTATMRAPTFSDNANASIAAEVDETSGHVVAFRGNGAAIDNTLFASLKAFIELRKVVLPHNGNWHDRKGTPEALYSGEGLAALADSKLEELSLGGGHLNDAGMAAIAKIKSLKVLNIIHTPVTVAGLKCLIGHPALETLTISPMGADRLKDDALPVIAQIPRLKQLGFHETYLSYADGLRHLAALKGTLQRVELRQTLVLPEDIERLKADLPGVEVQASSLAETREHVEKKIRRLRTWAPKAALERMDAAE